MTNSCAIEAFSPFPRKRPFCCSAGLSKEAAIRMAISTARNALSGLDGKLDPTTVVNRQVL
jgi:hypothetical protein